MRKYKPHNYWTKDKCLLEAKKFTFRSEFKLKSCSAYSIAQKNGWLNEICIHMPIIGNKKKRLIYGFFF